MTAGDPVDVEVTNLCDGRVRVRSHGFTIVAASEDKAYELLAHALERGADGVWRRRRLTSAPVASDITLRNSAEVA